MNEPNFDHSDGNWEDFSQGSSCGESQWRGYLKNSDRETARFISIYNCLKDKPNHLDEVATQMGWDADDISLKDKAMISTRYLSLSSGCLINNINKASYHLKENSSFKVENAKQAIS